MAICSSCSCNPCCCPEPHPVPAPPVVSVESHPAALPDCPSCPPVIHEVLESFVIPSIDESVTVDVCTSEAWPVGMCVHITDGNKKAVLKIVSANSSSNTIELRNDGSEQTDSGGTVMSGTVLMLLHGLCPDEEEEGCWVLGLRTISAITVPQLGGQTEVQLNICATIKEGQKLFIEGFGCVDVVSQSQETPFAIIIVQFDDLYSSTPGDSITGGAYVTTSDFCYPADFCDKVAECLPPSAGAYLDSATSGTVWALTALGGAEADVGAVVTVPVTAGDVLKVEGNAVMQSPRNALRFDVSTSTCSPVTVVNPECDYEDGHDVPVDTVEYFTASQVGIFTALADGNFVVSWYALANRDGNGPETNIYNRTIIVTSA